MSLSADGRRCVTLVLAALLTGVLAVPAEAQPAPADASALDITTESLELALAVESLDGSVIDVESASKAQTTLAADVLFEFDRADLTPVAGGTLDQVADNVRANAKGPVQVDGYTDSVGDDAYNKDLSQRRAAAVAAALTSRLSGRPTELRATGRGESDPVAPNTNPDGSDNPTGRAKNRRVTISFAK